MVSEDFFGLCGHTPVSHQHSLVFNNLLSLRMTAALALQVKCTSHIIKSATMKGLFSHFWNKLYDTPRNHTNAAKQIKVVGEEFILKLFVAGSLK